MPEQSNIINLALSKGWSIEVREGGVRGVLAEARCETSEQWEAVKDKLLDGLFKRHPDMSESDITVQYDLDETNSLYCIEATTAFEAMEYVAHLCCGVLPKELPSNA